MDIENEMFMNIEQIRMMNLGMKLEPMICHKRIVHPTT